MAPKKKAGGKKKKSARPAWMSEELYALSQNLAKLQEFWCGEVKDTKGKGKDGKPLPEYPNISREQAGRFMWQLLFPSNKASKPLREECIKLQVVETSIKIMNTGKDTEMTPAMGILAVLVENVDQCRQVFLDNKPNPIPGLLKAFSNESASLKATACALLRVVAVNDDARARLWRSVKEWDWSPLITCLQLQDRSALGGRNAAHDAMAAMSALCCAPEWSIANGACEAVVASGGLKPMVELLSDRVSHPMTRAGVLSVLHSITRRNPGAVSEQVVISMSALKPLVNMFDHPIIPLVNKAHAAACLLRFIMPDKLWKDASALAPPKAAAKGKKAPAPAPIMGDAGALPAIADPALAEAAAAAADAESSKPTADTAAAAAMASTSGPEPTVPDAMLLDDETREAVLMRARMVAEAGAIRPLVLLCNGPDGPLPDLEAKAAAEAAAAAAAAATTGEDTDGGGVGADGKKKPKKAKKKGKKKGKLEPGMAEAQTFSSAVLRLISMDEGWREPVVAAGAIRYLLPLLEAKLSPARWNARQLLINLSMTPSLMATLQLYKVPAYVHGANIPGSHYARPFTSAGDDLEKLPPHLAETRSAAQAARGASATGAAGGAGGGAAASGPGAKPAALKTFGGAVRPTTLQVSS